MNCPFVIKKCNTCKKWLVACSINFCKHKRTKDGLRNECKSCQREYRKRTREQARLYRKENDEKIKNYKRQYYQENREEIREKYKSYYENNKEKILEHNRQYQEEHIEELKLYKKKYHAEHREHILDYLRKYNRDNKERLRNYKHEYRLKNKEYFKEYNKKYCASDVGIIKGFNNATKRRLKKSQGSGITKDQWIEMMEFFDWKCAYSGISLQKNNRSIDHVIPLDNDGEHEIWNCVPMYMPYNSSKHTREMVGWYKEQEYFSQERLDKIYKWLDYAYDKYNTNKINKIKGE